MFYDTGMICFLICYLSGSPSRLLLIVLERTDSPRLQYMIWQYLNGTQKCVMNSFFQKSERTDRGSRHCQVDCRFYRICRLIFIQMPRHFGNQKQHWHDLRWLNIHSYSVSQGNSGDTTINMNSVAQWKSRRSLIFDEYHGWLMLFSAAINLKLNSYFNQQNT